MLLPSRTQPPRSWLCLDLTAGSHRKILIAAATLTAGLLVGCGTPAGPSAPAAKATAPVPAGLSVSPATLDNLKKGMTTADLIAQWGQPGEKRKLETKAGAADIWIYSHVVRTFQRQVATSTRMVPVFDSLTGGTKEVPEPVFSQETVQIVRLSKLLIIENRLVEWKVSEETAKKNF